MLEAKRIAFRAATPDGLDDERAAAASVTSALSRVVGADPRIDVEGDARVQRPVGAARDVDEPGHGASIASRTNPRNSGLSVSGARH